MMEKNGKLRLGRKFKNQDLTWKNISDRIGVHGIHDIVLK